MPIDDRALDGCFKRNVLGCCSSKRKEPASLTHQLFVPLSFIRKKGENKRDNQRIPIKSSQCQHVFKRSVSICCRSDEGALTQRLLFITQLFEKIERARSPRFIILWCVVDENCSFFDEKLFFAHLSGSFFCLSKMSIHEDRVLNKNLLKNLCNKGQQIRNGSSVFQDASVLLHFFYNEIYITCLLM